MPNLFRVEPPMNPSPSQDNVIANTQLLKNTVGFTCKNLFGISPYNNLAIFGDSQGAYINSQTNGVSYLAHVEKNKDYTVSKNSGVGDSFIIAGFATQPTIPNTTPETNSEVIIDDSSLNSYTFNSDDYEYIAFTVNKTTSGTLTDIQAMICDANLLDKSYEQRHDSVDNLKQNKNLSSALNINGTTVTTVESALSALNSFVSKLNAPLITTGLTVTDNTVRIVAGGYKTFGNMTYVQIVLEVSSSTAYNFNTSIVSGFPAPNSWNVPLSVTPSVAFITEGMGTPIGVEMSVVGSILFSKPSDVSVGDYIKIIGWYQSF